MSKIILILICSLLSFTTMSQIVDKGEAKIAINQNGDTMLIMNLSDARTILADLMDKQILDSVLTAYEEKDSLNTEIIGFYKSQIEQLQKKIKIQELQIVTLTTLTHNKNSEITILDRTIKEQKKEIKRQKRFKTIGIMSALIIPTTVVLLLLKR